LKKEEESLKHVFKAFDKDGKGEISRKDFVEQIEKLYGDVISEEILHEFFSTLDLDKLNDNLENLDSKNIDNLTKFIDSLIKNIKKIDIT
jgi:hypothetical protein